MPISTTSCNHSALFRVHVFRRRSWLRFGSVGLVVMVTLCFSTSPPAGADETDVLIAKALQSSGVAGQVETLFEALLAAIPDDVFPNPKVKRSARSMMKKAAGKESLLPLISKALKADFRRDLVEQVIAFYGSPLGKEVGRLTGKSCTLEALSNIRVNRELVVDVPERRLQAMQRILEAQRVVEFNARLLSAVIKGLAEAPSANGAGRDLRSPDVQDMLESVETDIRSDEETAWTLGLVACANTFRSLKDEELERLAGFYESEAGKWFVGAVQAGLEAAIRTAARALAEVLSGMKLPGKRNDSKP